MSEFRFTGKELRDIVDSAIQDILPRAGDGGPNGHLIPKEDGKIFPYSTSLSDSEGLVNVETHLIVLNTSNHPFTIDFTKKPIYVVVNAKAHEMDGEILAENLRDRLPGIGPDDVQVTHQGYWRRPD